jgi:N utilization substance protein B
MKQEAPAAVLESLPAPPQPLAATLVAGVDRNRARIDELISSHAEGWALERMPAVDRNILRLAVFELLESPETPVAVVIDEAVELAKDYSTEDSPRYVNGVLSAVAARLAAAAL